MPRHKSCKKRLRRSVEQRTYNNAVKTRLRKTIKDSRIKLASGEPVDLKGAYSDIDKVSGKGIIHKRKAARLKSRLAKASAKKTK